MPTAAERLIWGFGDGSTLPVYDTSLGRLGAVICWENYMPMLRMTMYAKGIQIYCAPTADSRETWLSTMRHVPHVRGHGPLSNQRELPQVVLRARVRERTPLPALKLIRANDPNVEELLTPMTALPEARIWRPRMAAHGTPTLGACERSSSSPRKVGWSRSDPDVLKIRFSPMTRGQVALPRSRAGGEDGPVEHPDTRYAWNGDVALAYQVLGNGPPDLLYLQGFCSHIDLNWESPHLARFLRGLAARARLIVTDRRGWGCSDRFSPSNVPPLEALAEDIVVVLDAASSEQAVVFASWDAALIGEFFAATFPDRATGLILCDPFVTFAATEETPWMYSDSAWGQICEDVRATWGTTAYDPLTDPREDEWYARYQRSSIAPGALIAETRRFLAVDARSVLPLIQAPTLILSPSPGGDGGWSPENGRFLASRITGSRLVELPSDPVVGWHHWYGRAEPTLREIDRFIASLRDEESSLGRVLATVLFTDIVGSTARTSELGDRAWKDLLERHNTIVRALLGRYRGREIDTAGDGFFATFDGPARAVRCAIAIVQAVRALDLEVRVGVHTGEVETVEGKVGGIAVNTGARVGAIAEASEVLVTQTVKDLVAGAGLTFDERGERTLKGIPEAIRVYAAGLPAL